ncbi:MAG TPA: hypothetical protein VG675_25510 [Bryobacteraceae bacterium]|nr:hypothetical protein [Bryobacteraceae bacterium]
MVRYAESRAEFISREAAAADYSTSSMFPKSCILAKIATGLSVAALLMSSGCGYIGDPLPPLANIPGRVEDLSVLQRGGRIVAQFTLPRLTTEGVVIKGPLKVDLRIGPGGSPFQIDEWAATAKQIPEGQIEISKARYEIPAAEWTGKEVILGVRTVGTNGKESDWSNLVTVPVVAAPERPGDVRAEATAQGVHLTWRAQGNDFRVYRRSAPGERFAAVADVPQPDWTDANTESGKTYNYQVQTIVKLGDNREAESDPSAVVSVTPRDTFPPAIPSHLRAAPSIHSVELTWDRNLEPDLAGYRVYRSVAGGPFQKIGDVNEVPTYSDRDVQPGKTYRYTVSAVDQSGNESPQSSPVETALP